MANMIFVVDRTSKTTTRMIMLSLSTGENESTIRATVDLVETTDKLKHSDAHSHALTELAGYIVCTLC